MTTKYKYTVYGKEVPYLLNHGYKSYATSLDDLVKRSAAGATREPRISRDNDVVIYTREATDPSRSSNGGDYYEWNEIAVWRHGDRVWVAARDCTSCELKENGQWEWLEVDKNVDLTNVLVLATRYSQMVPA